jgi:flagellar hook-associated protein 1 FlgK
MSLFSSMQMAGNTLHAMQLGLQVVGQNIANTNTPGYIRERILYEPSPVQRIGNLVLGTGVQVTGIVQNLDQFVLDRLRSATSDRAGTETQEEVFYQLEAIFGELSDIDLSTSLTDFFSSISEVVNQPENLSIRNLAVLRGQAFTQDVNALTRRARTLREDTNKRVLGVTEEINTLSQEIAALNVRIAITEGGEARTSDAGALRDQRNKSLERLAEIVDIRVSEQPSGAVNVTIGGETLVSEGRRREVFASISTDRGLGIATVHFVETDSPLQARAGELAGLYEARDTIVGGFLDDLDEFVGTLIFEFNKAYSQGQGLSGFDQVTSEFGVEDPNVPLDAAGLPFTPVNGAFDVVVRSTETGLTSTETILVDLNGLNGDLSLTGLAAALNNVDGISASISATGELSIQSDSIDSEFAFANDTSGVLAALGVNTYFSGTQAIDIGVNGVLQDDASKFAASRGGIGEDPDNAIRLAAFLDEPLAATGGASLADTYEAIANNVTQGSTIAAGVADGFRAFEATVEAKHLSITSVNLDEEAIRLISLQRTYQAAARFVQAMSELLDVLVNL